MTVSRSLLFLLLPVTDTVTRTGLMATAAAAVRRAIPARGAIRRARGLAVAPPPCLCAAIEKKVVTTRQRGRVVAMDWL